MGAHAKLSPSSAERWLHCPGSIQLVEQLDEQGLLEEDDSTFAAEGTAAHEFAAAVLERSKEPATMVDDVLGWRADMVEHVEAYADYVRMIWDQCDGHIQVETPVEFDQWVSGGRGTLDAAVLDFNTMTAHVVDFKYGVGHLVRAKDNPQLKLYAAGVMQTFAWAGEMKRFILTIVQPRKDSISTFEISREELLDWLEDEVRPAATTALAPDAPLVPSVEACRWCRARALCKARAEKNLDAFRSALGRSVSALTPAEIADTLLQTDDMKKWLSDIEDEALRIARSGKELPGFKVVRARARRRWIKGQEEVIAATLGEEAWTKKLIGLTEAQKKLGKDHSIFSTCVETPEGKETLAPVSDPRPSVADAAAIFSQTEGQK